MALLTRMPPPDWRSVSRESPMLVARGRGSSSQNCGADHSHKRSAVYPLLERFEVRAGDQAPLDVAAGTTVERAEQSVDISRQLFGFRQDVWVAYDLMLLAGAPVTAFFLLLGQFHHVPDPGDLNASPPWCLEWWQGGVSLTTRTSPLRQTPANTSTTRRLLVPNPPRDTWMRFVFRVNFDWNVGGSGGVQAWVNGDLRIDDRTPVGFNDENGVYAKFGIYRGADTETLAAIYHDFEVGYKDLSYRISARPNLPSAGVLAA